jgi:hypothetical protein
MTELSLLLALIAFLIAIIVPNHPSWNAGRMIALGLFLWLLPTALTALHISHS